MAHKDHNLVTICGATPLRPRKGTCRLGATLKFYCKAHCKAWLQTMRHFFVWCDPELTLSAPRVELPCVCPKDISHYQAPRYRVRVRVFPALSRTWSCCFYTTTPVLRVHPIYSDHSPPSNKYSLCLTFDLRDSHTFKYSMPLPPVPLDYLSSFSVSYFS